jgi:hypothetical protein
MSTRTTRQHIPANNAVLLRENNLQYTKQCYLHKRAVRQRYKFRFLCALTHACTHARTHTHTHNELYSVSYQIGKKINFVLPAVRVFKSLHPVSSVITPATQTVQSSPSSPRNFKYGKNSLYNLTYVFYTKYSL